MFNPKNRVTGKQGTRGQETDHDGGVQGLERQEGERVPGDEGKENGAPWRVRC